MKRILLLSFGILFSASLGVLVSRYTLAFTTQETVTERIFSEAGISQVTDPTDPAVLEQLALSSDAPFQNLYLYMYSNVLDGPQKAAIKMLSSRTLDGLQFNEDELMAITEGDTTPILDKKEQKATDAQNPDTVQSQTDAQNAADAEFQQFLADNDFDDSVTELLQSMYETQMRPQVAQASDATSADTQAALLGTYTDIMDAYQKELDLQRDNRKLAYQALASEMFLNNDLSDSANIDLLYDLDLAHYVMFGTYITYPDRSGDEAVDLASIPVAEDSVQLSSETVDTVSPYACLDDTALHDALDAFDADGSGATADAPSVSNISIPDASEVAEEVVEDPANTKTATQAAEKVANSLAGLENFLTQISGTKGDWTRSLPCGDVFCITVKLVDGEDDPVTTGNYTETDNCIACHIAYINKAMTQTTESSLVPSKVSKNWFEDATCKEAGNQINLDINVYAIKKSIDLDPGDDADSVPAKDIEDLKQTLIHLGAFPQKDAPETIVGKTPADVDCESLLSMNTLAGSPQSLQEVQAQCQESADEVKAELTAVYDQSQVEGLNTNQATLYQQVSAELYKMAVTFRNFQEQLQATYKGDNAPLPELLKKDYCES